MIERIVVVNDLAQPKGGASQLAMESAVQFARRGHRVTVLCGSTGNDDLADEGIEVVALGQGRLLESNPVTTAVRGLYNRPAASMVARWIAANDTPRTVYHIHGWSQILSPALFNGMVAVRGRTLVHAHDFFFSCPNGAMFHFGKDAPCPAKPMSLPCIASACDRRGMASKLWRVGRQSIQNALLRDYPLPLLLIHGGMAPYFARSGVLARDMAVLPNPVRPFVPDRIAAERNRSVLFVGRLEATKGIDLAAEACRRAGVRLVAVGTGDLGDDLKRCYPEMSWVGRHEHDRIAAFAREARVAVMPSRHIEPFGLAAVEALWSGLPVVTSADALIAPDIVAAGAGLAVNPRDADAFAGALAGIFADDALTLGMSENAHRRTTGLALSPDRWLDALEAAYEGYLDGGRPGLVTAVRRSVAGTGPAPVTTLAPRLRPFRNRPALWGV
ncbi:glycosyltransferase family 4 protein [Novosphingobium kaempferiae]|uniref:glycosyltransferase family 4 protein n=1 Tax=Novosphingobium kaempferiae TaxID=2896849 RepID=UPI001E2E3CCB|nr:glycosyltransferase family 4 protein [Novosphingobium kaempferiae]